MKWPSNREMHEVKVISVCTLVEVFVMHIHKHHACITNVVCDVTVTCRGEEQS